MTGRKILMTMAALAIAAIPVVAQARSATATVNPASALSITPAVRAGTRTKGEKIGQRGLIIGAGMIALGAGAIILAVDGDNDNDRPSSP